MSEEAEPRASSGQDWSERTYDENVRFVTDLGGGVVALLAPQPGERVLDLGCGDGVLSGRIAECGAIVVGVDASPAFVEAARARGVDCRLMDGQHLTFENEFDAVFSNAALHWMLEPDRVVAGVKRALRPSGRFVAEFGGFGNVAALATAMHAVGAAMGGDTALASPWYFPTIEEYGALLEAHGFAVDQIRLFARPTPLPTGVRGWLKTMRSPFFDQFGNRREEAYRRVEQALAPALRDRAGTWTADYVRLRFRAFADRR